MQKICVPLVLKYKKSSGKTITYHRHELLGSGGFGAVYRVTDDDGHEFALKAIAKDIMKKPRHMEKLRSEIQIVSNHMVILKTCAIFISFLNYAQDILSVMLFVNQGISKKMKLSKSSAM